MVLAQVSDAATPVMVLAIVGILYGVANCLFGYRIFRVTLVVWGAVIGGMLGWAGGMIATGTILGAVLALLGALVGGVLFALLYFLGVFVLGAVTGLMAADALMTSLQLSPHPVVQFICALIFGIAALKLQKLLIIVSTAFSGSWAIVLGIGRLVGRFDLERALGNPSAIPMPDATAALTFATWLALGIIGVVVQYAVTAPRQAPEGDDESAEPKKDEGKKKPDKKD